MAPLTAEQRESPFLGRAAELALLREKYRSPRSELVVIYGRRRIGKSRLVQHFSRDKPSLQFEGLEGERTPAQVKHFVQTLRRQVQDPLLDAASIQSWDQAFTFLSERVLPRHEEKLVLFLDELPWMAAGRKKLVSLIKYFWDNHWKQRNVLLILCGSISSFMVDQVILSNALYGRASLEICLRGLAPGEAKLLFRRKRSKDEIL
ncbi:MAG: AAA family ATPase, partial [Planctomycetes bacterium]|nr:AAA family ATPase [Planctomycetota bacterium]